MLKTHYLTLPQISPEHIKEKITCIRAHRERIFYVALKNYQDKLIFHNYGHGGAGWTFLFGCVHESIRQFEQEVAHDAALKNKPITVLGAGCYGLLTAIILARKGYNIRVVAAEVDAIPSYKAAGFFFPRPRKCSTMQERAEFLARGMESYRAYQQIVQGTHLFLFQGAKLLPAYFGLAIDPEFGPYIQQGLMAAPEKVRIDFGNGKNYEVMEYRTIFIDSFVLMQELHRNISELRIAITKAFIDDFRDIPESVIFNCTGLGAKKLTGDNRIIPVQGHLIMLKNQPPLEQLQYMVNVKVTMVDKQGKSRDELIYYAPKESGIVGITFLRGENSLEANPHEFDRLLQRCKDFFGTNFLP